jgi:hypothetical protein
VSGRRRHLVSVWNPSVAVDAMDAHRALLIELVRRADQGAIERDDVYVWWGKVRSPNRQAPLGHLEEVLALEGEIPESEDAGEMHLYLTDYRSLYVGHVAAITREHVLETDADHVPDYYREQELACDCWFQLWDIRRLVHDDTLGVVHELKQLRNTHYNDRPVSIYGGMVQLPLVVYRDDDTRFFDPVERERLLDGEYWVEFDARNAGIGAVERDLRDNLFGTAAWAALDPASRTFIATGERVFREHRGDASFDFGQVLGSFAKALEKECRQRLRQALQGVPERDRLANVGGATVDLLACRELTLGQFTHALRGERRLAEVVRGRLHHGDWFAGQLPVAVDAFRHVRNDGTHDLAVARDTAVHWRNQLLGVGCHGLLVQLAGVRPRGQRVPA